MTEADDYRETPDGFRWSPWAKRWQLLLREEVASASGVETGNYVWRCSTDANFREAAIIDTFASSEPKLLFARKIIPLPPLPLLQVHIHRFGPPEITRIGECTLRLSGEELRRNRYFSSDPLTIAGSCYRAYYDYGGKLTSVSISPPSTMASFVCFNFSTALITDLAGHELAKLPDLLNQSRLLFNERYFSIDQGGEQVTARVIKPGVEEERLCALTLPNQLPMQQIIDVLVGGGKGWLELLQHIPVQISFSHPLPRPNIPLSPSPFLAEFFELNPF